MDADDTIGVIEGAEDTKLGKDTMEAEGVTNEGVMDGGAEGRLGDPVSDIVLIDRDGIVESDNIMLRGHRFLW